MAGSNIKKDRKRQKKKGKLAKDRDRKKRQTDRRNRKIVLATH